jgi:chorismate mutase / prephenate dehydratase
LISVARNKTLIMAEDNKIDQIRQQIDQIDNQLVDLVDQRVALATAIAKCRDKLDPSEVSRLEPEANILGLISAHGSDKSYRKALLGLFRDLITICTNAGKQPTVTVLGPKGTYCEAAAQKYFGVQIDAQCVNTIEDVFREVETHATDYGVVPVENSTEGGINNTLDSFQVSPLKICGEINLPIRHCLMSLAQSSDGIVEVLAHSQSLAQCRQWLATNLPGIPVTAVSSNAEAARLAAEQPNTAAIAGESTASLYGLNVLRYAIQDIVDNTTRFFVISEHTGVATGNDRTSLMLSARNEPGALYGLLRPLADHGVSMSKIESRPSRSGMWEYMFFVDIGGHIEDDNVARAVQELRKNAALVKLLGSYPIAH